MVIFPPFPVPEPDIVREDPLFPTVDHELVLRDRPVLVNVHPGEQPPSELVRLGLVVLVIQQTQDGLNNLQTKRQSKVPPTTPTIVPHYKNSWYK